MNGQKKVGWIVLAIVITGILLGLFQEIILQEISEKSSVKVAQEANAEQYAFVISTLKPGQAYACVNIGTERSALLVSNFVYDYSNGINAAFEANIYAFDKNGTVVSHGTAKSDTREYPLSVKEGYLYTGGENRILKSYVREGNKYAVTKEIAQEISDAEGNVTHYFFSMDQQFAGNVADDSNLKRLQQEYSEAAVISFTVVE